MKTIIALAALFVGCGGISEPKMVRPDANRTWPECNPSPGYVSFRMETCPGYNDVGVCRWLYSDGRNVEHGDCYSLAIDGYCVNSCDEVQP